MGCGRGRDGEVWGSGDPQQRGQEEREACGAAYCAVTVYCVHRREGYMGSCHGENCEELVCHLAQPSGLCVYWFGGKEGEFGRHVGSDSVKIVLWEMVRSEGVEIEEDVRVSGLVAKQQNLYDGFDEQYHCPILDEDKVRPGLVGEMS